MALKITNKPGEDLQEYPTDSILDVAQKRGKKAALAASGPDFCDRMLLAVVSTVSLGVVGDALQ